jgi:hypothetical protein
MRYTQSQIRDLISISVDDFKTWRKIIPALATHRGHGPTFTPGDVVALAIVAKFVREFGIRVGTVAAQLNSLFNACHGKSWLSLESCIVLVHADGFRLVHADTHNRVSQERTTIVVPCAPIISRLQSALTTTEVETVQGYLHFPPTAISNPNAQRGRRA